MGPPGSSDPEILQARTLELAAISFSKRGFSICMWHVDMCVLYPLFFAYAIFVLSNTIILLLFYFMSHILTESEKNNHTVLTWLRAPWSVLSLGLVSTNLIIFNLYLFLFHGERIVEFTSIYNWYNFTAFTKTISCNCMNLQTTFLYTSSNYKSMFKWCSKYKQAFSPKIWTTTPQKSVILATWAQLWDIKGSSWVARGTT